MRSIDKSIPAQEIEGYIFATCHTGSLVEVCQACNDGIRPEYHYWFNGECFQCWGSGIRHHAGRETKAYASVEEAAKAMRARNRAKARAAAKREEAAAARAAENRARQAAEEAREAARQEEAEARQARQTYYGEVGEKVTVTGTIARMVYIPGDWGRSSSQLVAVTVDEAGSQVAMFTSAAWSWEAEEGDELTLSGTVKKHDIYRDTKQTTITRPRRIN